jgi:ABC-type glycerol-3-phosphate transport system permease component/LmbE family N-acetylglucosaminyl deacetylase
MQRRLAKTGWNSLAVALFVVFMFPIYWMVKSSLSSGTEVARQPPHWIPARPSFDTYRFILERFGFWGFLGRSLIVAGVAVTLSLLVGSLAAYAVARFRFFGRTAFLAIVLAVQAIPPIALVVPIYIEYSRAHALNNLFALALVYVTFSLPLTIWIVATFIRSVPPEVEEAGMVDGLSRLGVFRRIVLPLAAPGFVAAALYSFILCWNEYVYGYSLLSDKQWTLSLKLGSLFNIPGLFGPFQMAFGTLMTIPSLVFFLVAYRWIATGLVGGAVVVRRPLVSRRRALGGRVVLDRRVVRRYAVRGAVAVGVAAAVVGGWRLHYRNASKPTVFAPVAAPVPARSWPLPAHADVVVFAPHPDDETIGAGGVIQQALERGQSVAVVYFTSGDAYAQAIGAIEDKTLDKLRPRDFLRLGAIRQREAEHAVAALGLPARDAIFLGYPDGALDKVAADRGSKPVRSPFTTQTATFGAAVRDFHSSVTGKGAPYTRAGALGDVEQLFRRLRPREVYVTMKADTHPDHAAAYDLVASAALATHYDGRLLTFIVHGANPLRWPWPRGANYGKRFVLRKGALPASVPWPAPVHVTLTAAEYGRKVAALDAYRSQMGLPFERAYLSGFLKREELFWPVPVSRS